MIRVREANETDVASIRDIFVATYGQDYPFPQYYDTTSLRRMIYADDTLLLVAEDDQSQRILGTASVVMEISALADLVGEFGRLAVHPDARGKGVGKLLMQGRLDRVQDRLHLGLVENRVAHTFSQRISQRFGFRPFGFTPMKLLVNRREPVALYGRYFGDALGLRRNNPHIVPEVHSLARLSLENCHLPSDCIVDDSSPPYPYDEDFDTEELTTDGYTSLLRIERGRIQNRDVFGPVRLHYGLFKLKARDSHYLLARRRGEIVGAIGFTIDESEKAVRVFELISLVDEPIRFLIQRLVEICGRLGIEYIEVDVNANAPRMQRTMLEQEFLPVTYVPAMVFHNVERLDTVRMVRLLVPFDVGEPQLTEEVLPFAEVVIESFKSKTMLPKVAKAIPLVPLFAGLSDEQVHRLAESCDVKQYDTGQPIIVEGQADGTMHVVLSGEVDVVVGKTQENVGAIGRGRCLGENVLVSGKCGVRHSATAIAREPMETAAFTRQATENLIRRRPDIGVVVFRNLASGIAQKLSEANARMAANT